MTDIVNPDSDAPAPPPAAPAKAPKGAKAVVAGWDDVAGEAKEAKDAGKTVAVTPAGHLRVDH